MINTVTFTTEDDLQLSIPRVIESVEKALEEANALNKVLQQLTGSVASPESGAFRADSQRFNTTLGKEERQSNGIYFTPKSMRTRLFEVCAEHGVLAPKTVLEPSAGSGEFVYDACERWPTATVYAVEKHPQLFRALKTSPQIRATHSDFLLYSADPVELVIGNPPYFVTKEKQPECMTGRGNIYVQFIYKCLTKHLLPGGVLAFVLPTSFYNCSYYDPCRKYMKAHTTMLHLENLDAGFYDTAQDTMLMVVRNTPPGCKKTPFYLTLGEGTFLSPKYKELEKLLKGSTTVRDLGLSVKTGEVVWNEHKEKLRETLGEVVIYSSNIVNNTLVLNNLKGEKKQRIQGFGKPAVTGPAVLIGRGYGNKFIFAHAVVPEGMNFYGENHINVVTGPAPALERLKKSLEDPRTAEFLRMFVGNGALSKSEIEGLLPVF